MDDEYIPDYVILNVHCLNVLVLSSTSLSCLVPIDPMDSLL